MTAIVSILVNPTAGIIIGALFGFFRMARNVASLKHGKMKEEEEKEEEEEEERGNNSYSILKSISQAHEGEEKLLQII